MYLYWPCLRLFFCINDDDGHDDIGRKYRHTSYIGIPLNISVEDNLQVILVLWYAGTTHYIYIYIAGYVWHVSLSSPTEIYKNIPLKYFDGILCIVM